ncbi:MAG: T9SS type A sorting domain-containing protein [Bacteroidales bacterium]|nr:T9SS type A sorting domain-containing protein [Bacteroidales bacterium]
MVLEAYPLICPEIDFTVQDHCDETCALDMINPASVIIQIIDATLDLKSFSYETEAKENAETARYTAKRELDADKIEAMNQRVADFDMNWTSGDNSIVASYYESKSAMFGEGYNLLGYDYYAGGIFEFLGHRDYPKVDPDLVRHFDWRERHGANDSLSPYYDGDTLGTGWLTSVKNQNPHGTCWAFCAVGLTEAIANLYANEHLDFDLAERELIECDELDCDGGNNIEALLNIKEHGIINETCFPYDLMDCGDMACSDTCTQPTVNVKITDTLSIFDDNHDSVRLALIQHGPLTIGFNYNLRGGHGVVLTGYDFDDADSTVIWTIKNSWGADDDWGIYGFCQLKISDFWNSFSAGIKTPITSSGIPLEVNCLDLDNDGYYNWGIGDKPDSCDCPDIEDCDDNDTFVGGFDGNYNCQCLIDFISTIEHISSDTAWNDSIVLDHRVMIDSGACLTITNDVMCHPQVKITVNRGGKLILDGGLMTNSCPGLWEGIDVFGSDTCQNFTQYFGILEIRNGGTIENARIAVSNFCKECMNPEAYSGGIIDAKDGIFRNNQVAFEFSPFRNMDQGIQKDYHGSFSRCRFIYDNYLMDGEDFRYFIKLNQVSGITIKGCDFSGNALSTNPDYEESLKYRSGIYAYGSHFYVEDECINDSVPCNEYIPSRFSGLNYGVYALGITGREAISIRKSEFSKNNTGIYLSAEDYSSIVQNTFDVKSETISLDTKCGVYLDYCNGFQVEENIFNGDYYYVSMQNPHPCIGIVINNSGEEYNELYNNRFDSLFIGTLAQNVNRNEKGDFGLQILCNDYSKGYYDISVTAEDSVANPGIAYNQGSGGLEKTSPANNTFSYSFPVNGDSCSDYKNECENVLYWYLLDTLAANLKPKYYSIPEVNPLFNINNNNVYQKDSCCPSSFIFFGENAIGENRAILSAFDTKIDSVKSILFNYVDGGDTYSLTNEIQNSTPTEGEQLYELLSSYSPYLSDSAMVSSVEKENVLIPEMLTSILCENPHAAKADKVQNALDDRNELLSEEQRIAIDQGWFLAGEKEKKESLLSKYKGIYARSFNNLSRIYKTDTSIDYAFDSLTMLYTNNPEIQSKYKLALEFTDKGDSTAAYETLESIPVIYSLTDFQQIQYQQYYDLIDITLIVIEETSILPDSLQVATLVSLSNSGIGQIRALARNLLVMADELHYSEPYIIPGNGLKSNNIKRIPVKQNNPEISFTIYPNPATESVWIEFVSNRAKVKGSIQLIDLTGKVIKHISIKSWQIKYQLSVSTIKSGMYFIRYLDSEGHIDVQKLIINHE